jgi:WD40 repeat protein
MRLISTSKDVNVPADPHPNGDFLDHLPHHLHHAALTTEIVKEILEHPYIVKAFGHFPNATVVSQNLGRYTAIGSIVTRTYSDYYACRQHYSHEASWKGALAGLGTTIWFDIAAHPTQAAGIRLVTQGGVTFVSTAGAAWEVALPEIGAGAVLYGLSYGATWTAPKVSRSIALSSARKSGEDKPLQMVNILDKDQPIWLISYQPNPDLKPNEWKTLKLIDIARLDENEFAIFQQQLDREYARGYLGVEWQKRISSDITNARKARSFFVEQGSLYTVDPFTFEFFVFNDSWEDRFIKSMINDDPFLFLKFDQEGQQLTNNWVTLDPTNSLNLWGADNFDVLAAYNSYLAQNQLGFLTPTGNVKFEPTNWPMAETNSEKPSQSQVSQSPNENTKIFVNTFDLTQKQAEQLDRIDRDLKVEYIDDNGETVRMSIGAYTSQQIKSQKEQQKWEKRKKETYASFQLVGYLGQAIGSRKMVEYASLGSALFTVGLAAAEVYAQPYSPVAWVSLIESVSVFVGLLNKKQAMDPYQVLQKELQNISQQLNEIKGMISQGFLAQQLQLQNMFNVMIDGFQTTLGEIYVNRLIITPKLNQIQSSIYQLSLQVNRQIAALWLNDLIESVFTVDQIAKRYNGRLTALTADRYEALLDKMVYWMCDKSAHYNATAECLYFKNQEADQALTVINSDDVFDIIGFLAVYAKEEIGINIVDNETILFNPNIWLRAFRTYRKILLSARPDYFQTRDPNNKELIGVIQAANRFCHTCHTMKNNYKFFLYLAGNYADSLRQVYSELDYLITKKMNATPNRLIEENRTKYNASLTQLEVQPISCGMYNMPEIDPHDNTNAITQRIQQWNSAIAQTAVPKFYAEYINALRESLENDNKLLAQHQPLATFISTDDGYLLPLQQIFNDTQSVTVKLPKQLIRAERKELGDFRYALTLNFGPNYTTATYQLKISFFLRANNSILDVGTIQLKSDQTPAIVQTITPLLYLNVGKYAEPSQTYERITTPTLSKVSLLAHWQTAVVIKFDCNYQDNNEITAGLEQGEAPLNEQALQNLSNDLVMDVQTPDDPTYVDHVIKAKKWLDKHQLHFELFQCYARLFGLPQTVTNQLNKLWDKSYIIQMMTLYAPALNRVNSDERDSFFKVIVDEHLQENQSKQNERFSLRLDITLSKLIFLLSQYAPRNNTQKIAQFAENAVRTEVQSFLNEARLSQIVSSYIEFKEEIDKLTWPNDDYSPKVNINGYPYDVIDLDLLLTKTLRERQLPNVTVFAPIVQLKFDGEHTYYENNQDHPFDLVTTVDKIKEITDAEHANDQQKSHTCFLPLCFQQNIGQMELDNSKLTQDRKLYWVLLVISVTWENGQVIYSSDYIDPVGMRQDSHILNTIQEVQNLVQNDAHYQSSLIPVARILYDKFVHFRLKVNSLTQIINIENMQLVNRNNDDDDDNVDNQDMAMENNTYTDTGPLLIENSCNIANNLSLRIHNIGIVRSIHSLFLKEVDTDATQLLFDNQVSRYLKLDPWKSGQLSFHNQELVVFDEFDLPAVDDSAFSSIGLTKEQGLSYLRQFVLSDLDRVILSDDVKSAFLANDGIWASIDVDQTHQQWRNTYLSRSRSYSKAAVVELNFYCIEHFANQFGIEKKEVNDLVDFLECETGKALFQAIPQDHDIIKYSNELLRWHDGIQTALRQIDIYCRTVPACEKYISYLEKGGRIGTSTAKLIAMRRNLFSLTIWKLNSDEVLDQRETCESNIDALGLAKHHYHLMQQNQSGYSTQFTILQQTDSPARLSSKQAKLYCTFSFINKTITVEALPALADLNILDPSIVMQERHANYIYAVKPLPCNRVATGARDNTVKIYNLDTGLCERTLTGHGNFIHAITVLHDGTLVSSSMDSSIRFWNAEIGDEYADRRIINTHNKQGIYSLTLISEGILASGGCDNKIALWNLNNNTLITTLVGHGHYVNDLVALSRNRLASVSHDGSIYIWDLANNSPIIPTYKMQHGGSVRRALLLPDGTLATSGHTNIIKIWNVDNGNPLYELPQPPHAKTGHGNHIYMLALLPNKLLVSGSNDSKLKVWNTTTRTCIQTIDATGQIYDGCVSTTGNLITADLGFKVGKHNFRPIAQQFKDSSKELLKALHNISYDQDGWLFIKFNFKAEKYSELALETFLHQCIQLVANENKEITYTIDIDESCITVTTTDPALLAQLEFALKRLLPSIFPPAIVAVPQAQADAAENQGVAQAANNRAGFFARPALQAGGAQPAPQVLVPAAVANVAPL